MASPAYCVAVVCAIITLAPATGSGSKLLLLARQRAQLRVDGQVADSQAVAVSPEDRVTRTLLALDANHDGSIDTKEVAAFANAQGLDSNSVVQEFAGFDANGDGVLDTAEVSRALGGVSAGQAPSAPVVPHALGISEVRSEQLAQSSMVSQQAFSAPVVSPALGISQVRLAQSDQSTVVSQQGLTPPEPVTQTVLPVRAQDPSSSPAMSSVGVPSLHGSSVVTASTPTSQALLDRIGHTLDANGDGSIDGHEVAAFAAAQGLDSNSFAQQFSGLDANGDGVLDPAELSRALVGAPAEHAPTALVPSPFLSQSNASQQVFAPPKTAAQTAPHLREHSLMTKKRGDEASSQNASVVASSAPSQAGPSVQPTVATATGTAATETAISAAAVSGSAPAPARAEDDAAVAEATRSAAATFLEELVQSEASDANANELELKAIELRANSTSLAKLTVLRATEAGKNAAEAVAKQLLGRLMEIEHDARQAEISAATLFAKSKAELREADDLMAVVNTALSEDGGSSSAVA